MWILIVDDDEDIREVIGMVLEMHGYPTVRAFDGQNALDLLCERAERPALILLDLMMPRVSGADFVRQIDRDALRDVPIVILSGDPSARATAAALGAAACLEKPLDVHVLLETVQRLVPEEQPRPYA